MTVTLSPRDRRIHVFSVSDGPLRLAHQTYLSRLSHIPSDVTSLSDAFGAPIDVTYAEVFAVADIAPMGLRDYLAQAHDVAPATLAAEAARLDALSGDVVVLAPGALDLGGELSCRPELTHIASLDPAEADTAPRDLPPAVKAPHLASPSTPEGAPSVRPKVVLGVIVLALGLAALLLMLLA